MLRRVDAENRLQTLKEELDFQKSIYSEVSGAKLPLSEAPPQHRPLMPPYTLSRPMVYHCALSTGHASVLSNRELEVRCAGGVSSAGDRQGIHLAPFTKPHLASGEMVSSSALVRAWDIR